MSTNEEKQVLIDAFKALDKNGDGILTKQEIIHELGKFYNFEECEKQASLMMKQIDINKSGKIDYTEFIAASINRSRLLTKENLQTTFDMFDTNKNGKISLDELKASFKMIDVDNETWQQIVKEVDLDGDASISLQEFFQIFHVFEKK